MLNSTFVSTTVEVRDGRPVVVRAGDGAIAEVIRREVWVLRSIAGPGVPPVLDFEDTPAGARLVVGIAPPLALSRLATPAAVRALARIADVLARAHGLGISHGPIHDEDVLAAGDDVLLTGWHRGAEVASPEADVASFGRLVRAIAGKDRSLGAVAARTTAPDPPTMAALAEALRGLSLPVVPSRRRGPARHVRIGAMFACAAVGALLLLHLIRPANEQAEAVRTITDVVVRGNVVERAGRRWTVGEAGDVVAVGRWDCDGRALPAVLRPSTGRIWVFGAWPTGRAPVAGRPASTVTDAVRLRIRRDGRCDRLDAVDAQGRSTPVR